MQSDRVFPNGLGSHDIDNESGSQPTQIEAAVDSFGRVGKLFLGVFAVLSSVEGTSQSGLDFADDDKFIARRP